MGLGMMVESRSVTRPDERDGILGISRFELLAVIRSTDGPPSRQCIAAKNMISPFVRSNRVCHSL